MNGIVGPVKPTEVYTMVLKATCSYFPAALGILLVLNLSCVQKRTDLADDMSHVTANHELDPSVLHDSTLFNFEFHILNLHTHRGVDSIQDALVHIDGIQGFETSLQTSTCLIYTDSLHRYKSVMSAIEEAGYRIGDIFTMSGPGLTCDIQPEKSDVQEAGVHIESLDKSISSFKANFNQNVGKVRIVSILNPSCLSCVKGQRFINQLFRDAFPLERNLTGFTVWTSIDGWGKLEDAERLAPELTDDRMYHYWDPNMTLGKLYKIPLGFHAGYLTAWDVYMIYKPGVLWSQDIPPAPAFWMHKLSEGETGIKKGLYLDNEVFTGKLEEVLHPIE